MRTGVERDRAVLQVINSGPLIPSERTGRLVQPFQRTEQSRTGRSGGLGLGLSIVAAIAEAHGGQLEIQAGAEGGLDVTLTLAATAVNRIAP